jgi:uncharacterized membrane protein
MSEMTTSRLEAFSDGVIAIIITIMVLELRPPAQPTLAAVVKVAPVFISYTARLLWANLNLLFWMSLVPYVTDFMGKNYREPMAVALYGLDLFLCAAGFYLLRTELIRQSRHDPAMTEYHERVQRKNAFSGALYLLSAPLAYVSIHASFFIFVLIPAMYFLPEKKLAGTE